MLLNLIRERISYYQTQTLEMLDNSDPLNAQKCRAIQKELEYIIDIMQKKDNLSLSKDNYYSKAEVANIIGSNGSTVNRKTNILSAIKIKNKWYFPKDIVNDYAIEYRMTKKRGRKPTEKQ